MIEVRHELMQELEPNRGGTSQVDKSRKLPWAKPKAVNGLSD